MLPSSQLRSRIRALIQQTDPPAPQLFDELACELFQQQLQANSAYHAYCAALGITTPTTAAAIPGLPAAMFKRARVTCRPDSQPVATFRTSGTTESESGTHEIHDLSFYDTACVKTFCQYFGYSTLHSIPTMIFLMPSPSESPHSSLVHMLARFVATWNPQHVLWGVQRGELQIEDVCHSLTQATKRDQPCFIAGTAFAWLHLCDVAAQRGLKIPMPTGTKVLETGGFKGRSREVTRDELHDSIAALLQVDRRDIINEYGMTELTSQFYDRSQALSYSTEWKSGSPWARCYAVDPLTNQCAQDGQIGLLKIVDLLNIDSVVALQTEDRGIITEQGFRVLGRVAQAPPRGCSLPAEAWL